MSITRTVNGSTYHVTTNRVPRELHSWFDLPEEERDDFDYINGDDRFSTGFLNIGVPGMTTTNSPGQETTFRRWVSTVCSRNHSLTLSRLLTSTVTVTNMTVRLLLGTFIGNTVTVTNRINPIN